MKKITSLEHAAIVSEFLRETSIISILRQIFKIRVLWDRKAHANLDELIKNV
jgi:hypothetical protein